MSSWLKVFIIIFLEVFFINFFFLNIWSSLLLALLHNCRLFNWLLFFLANYGLSLASCYTILLYYTVALTKSAIHWIISFFNFIFQRGFQTVVHFCRRCWCMIIIIWDHVIFNQGLLVLLIVWWLLQIFCFAMCIIWTLEFSELELLVIKGAFSISFSSLAFLSTLIPTRYCWSTTNLLIFLWFNIIINIIFNIYCIIRVVFRIIF